MDDTRHDALRHLTDKWSFAILRILAAGPMRFGALRRCMRGITQKSLTQCLRRLERNGLIERRITQMSPIAVEYSLSELGSSFSGIVSIWEHWLSLNADAIECARRRFEHAMNS